MRRSKRGINWKLINATALYLELTGTMPRKNEAGNIYGYLRQQGYVWSDDESGTFDWRKPPKESKREASP